MSSKRIADGVTLARSTTDVIFTVDSANTALVLVKRIVGDIVTVYHELMSLRMRREELAAAGNHAEELESLRQGIEQHIDRLNVLHEELRDIGCELKDWSRGLVDFPAERDGDRIWLCWKLGEPEIQHWHEHNAGFAGRKRLDS